MNYNLKATGVEITAELRGYVEKKLAMADKLLSGEPPPHADVELAYEPLRDGQHFRAEFTLASGASVYRAEEWGQNMHAAVDLALDELLHALRDAKRKRINIFRRTAARVKYYLRGLRP